jgi:cysteine-rich repeat protein
MRFAGSILLAVLVAPLVACGSTPAKLPVCGDGVVDPDEPCDDGMLADTGACRPGCIAATCGDGVVGPAEACDDGNDFEGDGCFLCEAHPDELWRAGSFAITALAATEDGVVVGHYLFPEDIAAGKPLLEWLDRDGRVVASVAASGFPEGVVEPQRIAVGEGGAVAIVGGWRPSQSERASQAFVVAARPGQLLWTQLHDIWREDVSLVWSSASIHRDGIAVAGTELSLVNAPVGFDSHFVTGLYDALDGHERWYRGVDAPELSSLAASGVLAHADGTISAGGKGDGVPLVVRWSASGEQLQATSTPLDFQEIIQLGRDRAGNERAAIGYWDGTTTQKAVAAVDANGTLSDLQPLASFGYPEFTSDGRVLCTELDENGFESHLVIVDPVDHTRTVRPLGASINRVSVRGTRLYLATSDLYGENVRAIELTRAH